MNRAIITLVLLISSTQLFAQDTLKLIELQPSLAIDSSMVKEPLELSNILEFKQLLAQTKYSEDAIPGAIVNITEHGITKELINRDAHTANSAEIAGYRVCIFNDNGQDARQQAETVKAEFEESYPNINTYIVYENPYFKVSIGDCLSSEEAVMLLGRVSPLFPKAFIKSESIKLSEMIK